MHRSLHLGKPCGGREQVRASKGVGGQSGTLARKGGGMHLHCSSCFFEQFHTVQLSKTDGYIENIYHLVFMLGKSNQGKKRY